MNRRILFISLTLLVEAFSLKAQPYLLGMTSGGGLNRDGNIIQLNLANNTLTDLYDFTNLYGSGGYPQGSLTQAANGMLYGMTEYGGNAQGVIFQYDYSTTTFDVDWRFNGSGGAYPYGSLIQIPNGKLYGMTYGSGTYVYGLGFSYDPVANILTNIHEFDISTGANPYDSFILGKDGKLYGMTEYGGANYHGVIFTIDTGTYTYTDIYDLNINVGGNPYGNLIQLSNGMLYGMTSYGGANSHGTIIMLNPATNSVTDICDFTLATGSGPYGSLIQATNGLLYGVTASGGSKGYGVIFSFDTGTHAYTDLHDFNDTDGANPEGTLLQASNGLLYGMAYAGGTGYGTIFSFDPIADTFHNVTDFNLNNGNLPTFSKFIEVNTLLTGNKEMDPNANSLIYPNPNNGQFKLKLSSIKEANVELQVYNVLGEVVYIDSFFPTQSDNSIDLHFCSSGIYFYELLAENKKLIGRGKIIISK